MASKSFEIEPTQRGIDDDDDDVSPIEEVRLTVSNEDDPSLPVWTFRMWFLGLLSCVLLSFLNTFFQYRTEPLVISMISVQVGTLPIGRFMANVLPTTTFRIPGFGEREFSLNPGPFNMKEHVLISIFANAGSAFGSGAAYAISIVDIIRAFYRRKISFLASWILVITTQVLGYGWAGILRKYLVDPSQMCRMSRGKFFLIALICSFSWYLIPGYLFPLLSTISWVCWAFPKSLTAHQIGSGMHGLGLGSFSLDWSVIASYLGSPLISPFFAIVNVAVGYVLLLYVLIPIAYWGVNLYDAKNFPIFSSHLYNAHGNTYNVSAIVNDKFELDLPTYEKQGRIYLSVFFALSYGIGFAGIISTLTHVALFNGRDIYAQFRASYGTGKQDIHTRLMRKYEDIPSWWFYVMLVVSLILALILCIFMIDEIQMPWWGLIFAAGLAVIFTLPVSVITATTNQSPGLNIITEYIMGVILPGTIIAGTVNLGVAWWLLNTVENICQDELLPPNSPWTCPGDRVFFDASVIWGLVGPRRIFGKLGNYPALNWFFLGGAVGPVIVWLMQKAFPNQEWISLINLPVLLGATAAMPPATSVNFNCWIVVGTIFNYFVFKYRKNWWQRYNYVLSAALDAGLAFMGVILYFTLTMEDISLSWWGSDGGERCELATCPTAKGIVVDGCPVF
ncbi:oligopeptide transporter 2 [Quercus suber]|uniref:Oligopeptide transporter 2 n=1 Tax=Quercus suber TaxID=58331 RepID=A0AAW0LDQ3_QUESU